MRINLFVVYRDAVKVIVYGQGVETFCADMSLLTPQPQVNWFGVVINRKHTHTHTSMDHVIIY